MKKYKIIIILLIVALLCVTALVLGAASAYEQKDFSFEMHGVWIDSTGQSRDPVSFSLSGTVIDYYWDRNDKLTLQYNLPNDFPYLCKSSEPYDSSPLQRLHNLEYFGAFGYSYQKSINDSVQYQYALDIERELIVMQWKDNDWLFVASTQPEFDPQYIISHFQTFLTRNKMQ